MDEEITPRNRQRLVVFLDGTWNNKDDCTNVLNLYNLVLEGEVRGTAGEKIVQRKMYDAGVGTGVLDSISGGAFGNGLEVNVREAYDWLVEKFNDRGLGKDYEADEIYIFGFSRGAYTARSLAGFIARCGLLRRGAPLTVGELWKGYGALEREKQEEGGELWDRLLEERKFRQLEQLIRDPWNGGAQLKPECYNDTERLLASWSRRVRVTFLGVFDTVGAMGLDALAIPGLRSKAGRIHNMRISSVIERFCHALAIDENRSGFQHTPLLEFVPNQVNKEDTREGLRQRWFVGVHSNVGGGYESNPLAQKPLRWMLGEAKLAGLVAHDLPPLPVDEAPCVPRDSFSEFVGLIGPGLLRQKRNYRLVCPADEVRADRVSGSPGIALLQGQTPKRGFSLRSYETIDDSVWRYADRNKTYQPPQLVRFAQAAVKKKAAEEAEAAKQGKAVEPLSSSVREVAAKEIHHDWPAKGAGGYWMLYLWSMLAGAGLLGANQFFQIVPGLGDHRLAVLLAAAITAVAAMAVDCGESRLNLRLALDPHSAVKRAYRAAVFWTRSVLVLLFFAGAIGSVVLYLHFGWTNGDRGLWHASLDAGKGWWVEQGLLAAIVAIAVVLMPVAEHGINLVQTWRKRTPLWHRERSLLPTCRAAAIGAVSAAAGLVLTFCVLAFLGSAYWHVAAHLGLVGHDPSAATAYAADAVFMGRYLFLLVAVAYACFALLWVSKPLQRTNLGTLAQLMFERPRTLRATFEDWQERIDRPWMRPEEDRLTARRQVIGDALRESMWRDNLGFIPVYSLAWAYGMWFVATEIFSPGTWLGSQVGVLPLWLWIVVVTAAADWTESAFHSSYIDRKWEVSPRADGVFVFFANLTTFIKFVGFGVGGVLSALGIVLGAVRILTESKGGGWRGAMAATILLVGMALVVWLVFSARRRIAEKLSQLLPKDPAIANAPPECG